MIQVRALIARQERVLITSYTHSAVDTLLAKLVQAGVSPAFTLRLGSASSVAPALRGFVLSPDADPFAGGTGGTGGKGSTQTQTNKLASTTQPTSTSSATSVAKEPPTSAVQQLRARCEASRLVACTLLQRIDSLCSCLEGYISVL